MNKQNQPIYWDRSYTAGLDINELATKSRTLEGRTIEVIGQIVKAGFGPCLTGVKGTEPRPEALNLEIDYMPPQSSIKATGALSFTDISQIHRVLHGLGNHATESQLLDYIQGSLIFVRYDKKTHGPAGFRYAHA
jgi:hypothetical protein